MSVENTVEYYKSLLILQYVGKVKAAATVGALITPVIMDELPAAIQNSFNLRTAKGLQLDTLGKYVGVTRNGSDLNGNPISLNDTDFLSLMQMAIIKNTAGSSLATIQQLLNQNFPGLIFVFDFKNMQMGYFIRSGIGSLDLIFMLITQGLLPRPMGVQLSSIIYAGNLDSYLGFQSYAEWPIVIPNNTAPNDYTSGFPDPQTSFWLSYSDTA